MGITKLMLICLIGAIIEVLQMVLIDKSYFLGKPDPDAVTVIAHKVHEPGFNYIPGRQTYDDKSGRYVTDWKYEWEYEGKPKQPMGTPHVDISGRDHSDSAQKDRHVLYT